eukprot:EST44930.1 Hypothetical protein SS50377_14948 [Spironucleus salmonicida]
MSNCLSFTLAYDQLLDIQIIYPQIENLIMRLDAQLENLGFIFTQHFKAESFTTTITINNQNISNLHSLFNVKNLNILQNSLQCYYPQFQEYITDDQHQKELSQLSVSERAKSLLISLNEGQFDDKFEIFKYLPHYKTLISELKQELPKIYKDFQQFMVTENAINQKLTNFHQQLSSEQLSKLVGASTHHTVFYNKLISCEKNIYLNFIIDNFGAPQDNISYNQDGGDCYWFDDNDANVKCGIRIDFLGRPSKN